MNDRFEELAKTWLDRARDDLLWAKDTLDDKRFSGVCFLFFSKTNLDKDAQFASS